MIYRYLHKLWYWKWDEELEKRLYYLHTNPQAMPTNMSFLRNFSAEELIQLTKNETPEKFWDAVKLFEKDWKESLQRKC